jgi:hypothetical protein
MAGFTSFDEDQASAADPQTAGAIPAELPSSLEVYGTLWPTPADQVSDHSAEGAPWQATARAIPVDPPMGPLWQASHDGPAVPYDASGEESYYGQTDGPQPGWNHQGTDGQPWDVASWGPNSTQPNAWPQLDIGQPFTVDQGSAEHRTLATDQWDPTGKRVNPADAPSAPHELYGSKHYTRPRMIPFQLGALFNWNWADGDQFPSTDPGYYGVQAYEPNLAPRPQGAVAAQEPDAPYVASAVPAMAAPAPGPDYDLGL